MADFLISDFFTAAQPFSGLRLFYFTFVYWLPSLRIVVPNAHIDITVRGKSAIKKSATRHVCLLSFIFAVYGRPAAQEKNF